jgi:4-amino-4-deoxy-L-arabinose transferase-like glycosyltransferase
METAVSETENPKPQSRCLRRPIFVLLLVLAVYAIFLWQRFSPAIVTPDANGYWAQGSLLAQTGQTGFKPGSDSQYIGMQWLVTPDGFFYSRYPPGLAVIIAVIYKIAGYRASVMVNPVMAVLTLAGLFFLLRRLASGWWALAGVVALALNPTFNHHAIACDSHMAVTFFLTWGLFLLLRWSERGSIWEIFAAGLLLGAIPTIRYPEAIFGAAIVAFLLWYWRSRPRIWLHYLAATVGAAIPIIPLLVRNQLAFGSFWKTAYALTNEQTGFAWEYFEQHYSTYIRQLSGEGVGLLFGLGILGATWMCGVKRWRATGVMLVLLIVPVTVLYMFYYWGPEMSGGTMRFLLPTFVCYVAAGVWLLSHATDKVSPALSVSIALVLLAMQAVWGIPQSLSSSDRLRYQKQILAQVTDTLEKHTQHGDVILARQQFLQHLDFVRQWRLADQSLMRGQIGMGRFFNFQDNADAPSWRQVEKDRERAEKFAGMTQTERERYAANDIHQWAGNHKVYFVGTERDLRRTRGGWFLYPDSFKIIARIPLPEPPPQPRNEGLMGAGRPREQNQTSGGQSTQPPPLGGRFPSTQQGGSPRFARPGGGIFGLDFLQGEKELVIAEWKYSETNSR